MDPQGKRSLAWFWVGVVFVVYALYSGAVAVATSGDCTSNQRHEWQWVPPAWDCVANSSR